ncbi:MAG: hypothetical protein KTR14_04835 [Vampirovibrio sp.]|nr:hypothetical protein [Vampirovibrio sp.]
MSHPTVNIKRVAASGQSGMLAIGAIMMISLVAMGVGMSQMTYFNTQRTLTNRQSLQTYYVAEAGIQESIATRMIPRSNNLNYVFNAANPASIPPLFPESGPVYQDPINQTGLLGYYRYIILGGDPARDAAGAFDNNLVTAGTTAQNFYIVSNGRVCLNPETEEMGVDIITANGGDPACPNANFQVDELTLVAQIDMSRTDATFVDQDIVRDLRTFKNSNAVTLNDPVFIPGTGVTNTVNFTSAWNASVSNLSITPAKVVFHPIVGFGSDVIEDITTTNTVIATPIEASAVIRLLFEGPVDYRSMFANPATNVPDDCVANRNLCTVRVRNMNDNTVYGGGLIIPQFPSSTQVILFPPLEPADRFSAGTPYRIEIDANVSDYQGNQLGTTYFINFTT